MPQEFVEFSNRAHFYEWLIRKISNMLLTPCAAPSKTKTSVLNTIFNKRLFQSKFMNTNCKIAFHLSAYLLVDQF